MFCVRRVELQANWHIHMEFASSKTELCSSSNLEIADYSNSIRSLAHRVESGGVAVMRKED